MFITRAIEVNQMCGILVSCSEGYSEDQAKEPCSSPCIITIQWVNKNPLVKHYPILLQTGYTNADSNVGVIVELCQRDLASTCVLHPF